MYDFTQNKANKASLAKRKMVCGVGINDADYVVNPRINGKQVVCLIYRKWQCMLQRCYSAKIQERRPTYIGCKVTNDWLYFSNFRSWMLNQEWQGLDLDKDIKFRGNKIYSPENCLFIPSSLNTLLVDCSSKRGEWPVGVCCNKEKGRFISQLRFNGKQKYLGCFSTAKEASNAYQAARTSKIMQLIRDDAYPVATPFLAQHI